MMETILFLYVVVAVLIALGGATVILVRQGADRRYVIVALAFLGALFLLAYWAFIG